MTAVQPAEPVAAVRTPSLLCEACGYDIESLPRSSACPECGRAIRESLPEHRKGSPWQIRPGLVSYFHTNYLALRHPRTLFAQVRLETRRATALAVINTLLASFLIVYPWTGILIGDPLRRSSSALTALWVIPLQITAVAAFLFALTLVEWLGIQLIARRRRWRLLPEAAWQVCAHASIGWIVMALAMWLALVLWLNAVWFIPGMPQGGRGRLGGDALMMGFPAAGLIAGLLIFELLVWTGAKQCRYANARVRRQSEYAESAA